MTLTVGIIGGGLSGLTAAYELQRHLGNKFEEYDKEIQSHLIGKFIAKCTRLAQGMYSQKLDPIDVAREVFTIPKEM